MVGASCASGPGSRTSPATSTLNRPLRQLGISRTDSRELVELCRTQDRYRDRAGHGQLLLTPFARVMRVALNAIYADDGQHHVMPNACPLPGGKEVSGARREELLSRCGVVSCEVGDVDPR